MAETPRKFIFDTTGVNWQGVLPVVSPMAGAKEGTTNELTYLNVDASGNLKTTATITGDVEVDMSSVDTSGLIGKVSGGDFDTTYTSATTITCSNLPSYHQNLIADDIVSVTQIDTSGAVVATYARDNASMSVTTNVLTITGASFSATDSFVIYTNVSAVQTSLSTPEPTHTSPNDFTATYTSSSTITLSGYPSDLISDEQVLYIVQLKADNTYTKFVNGGNCYIAFTAGVLTIYNAGTPFVTGDSYRIGLKLQQKAYDASQDIMKTIDQSPARDWYTGSVPLVTASDVGSTNDAWLDQGSEIAMGGKNRLAVYVKLTPNNSTGVMLQVLSKDASGGTNEYVLDIASSYQKVLGVSIIPIVYTFETDGLIPFVQIQTKASVVGVTEGTVDISIVKAWV